MLALLNTLSNSSYIEDCFPSFHTSFYRAVIKVGVNPLVRNDWTDYFMLAIFFFRLSLCSLCLKTNKLLLSNILQVYVTNKRYNEMCVDASDAATTTSTCRILFTDSVIRGVTLSYNLLLLVDPATARQTKEVTKVLIMFSNIQQPC